MQLLTHYDHVIVQSLIVHPVCNAERLIRASCLFVCLLVFLPQGTQGGFSQQNRNWTEIRVRQQCSNPPFCKSKDGNEASLTV